MYQRGFTFAVEIKDNRRHIVSEILKEAKEQGLFKFTHSRSDFSEQGNDSTIKSSWLTIPAQMREGQQKELPAMFLILTTFTGKTKEHLKELVANNGNIIRECLSHCSVNSKYNVVEDEGLVKYLKDHEKWDTFYSGMQYLSKGEMFKEQALYKFLQKTIHENRNALLLFNNNKERHGFLKKKAEAEFGAEALKFKVPWTDFFKAFWVSPILNSFAVIAILLLLTRLFKVWGFSYAFGYASLCLICVLALFYLLQVLHEYGLHQKEKQPSDEHIRDTQESQDNDVLNEFSLAGPVKPGRIRQWSNYFFLRLTKALMTTLFIPAVFNARWVGLNGYKRFTFFSNFTNQTVGYARDFIDTKARGSKINLIYGSADGYPKTHWLFKKGGYFNPVGLVKDILHYQHPTEFWYAPLKFLTIDNVRRNHGIRMGIAKELSEKKAEKWLNYFGGWREYKDFKAYKKEPQNDEIVEVEDLQSLVAAGHGALRAGKYLLLKFNGSKADSIQFIEQIIPKITTASEVSPSQLINIVLSYCGMKKLSNDEAILSSFQREFREGMSNSTRSKVLGDEGENHPSHWHFGKNQGEFDAKLILLAKDEASLSTLVQSTKQLLERYNISIPKEFEADLLHDHKEHFGFVDGISNPRIKGLHNDSNYNRTQVFLMPGEFILGYKNEYGNYSPLPKTYATKRVVKRLENIALGLNQYYVKDHEFLFGKNGSFMVFRQMEQDVAAFWNYHLNQAEENENDVEEAIKSASKMVGRWPNGKPLTKTENRDFANINLKDNGLNSDDNDFMYYRDNDLAGKGCPYGAHIRRANPRDWLVSEKKSHWSQEMLRKKLMLRRGRMYGEPVVSDMDTEAIIQKVKNHATANESKRGLNFVALVSNIDRQFEFVQQAWIQSSAFAGLQNENDPLIGPKFNAQYNEGVENGDEDKPRKRAQNDSFTCPAHPVRKTYEDIPQFTRVRGGAYFFMPSIVALKYLVLSHYDEQEDHEC